MLNLNELETAARVGQSADSDVVLALVAKIRELEQATQLAYDYLSCADCTSDDSAGCSRHPNLHAKANRAASAALTPPSEPTR